MNNLSLKLEKYKKIGIVGLGLTGISSYRFFKKHNVHTVVFDENPKSVENFISKYGDEDLLKSIEDLSSCTHILVSPGVPLYYPKEHKVVQLASANNIKITSDCEVLYDLANDDAKFIGVTGTNGKSTTTSLIGHLLKESGRNCSVGGNIGIGALDLPLDSEIYVLELSSYQLDLLDDVKIDVAILLNITPDHLERHGSMANYIKVKKKIFRGQTKEDYAIICIDNEIASYVYEEEKLETINNTIGISSESSKEHIKDVICYSNEYFIDNYWNTTLHFDKNIYLQGKHNHINLACSYAACRAVGVSAEEMEKHIDSFVGLPHRMQYVGNIEKISFYNDSKATNADASKPALASIENIYWLLGGIPKAGGIERLQGQFSNVKKAYVFGEASIGFAITLKGKVPVKICKDLNSAFKEAYQDALSDGMEANILLSPACSSLDQFKNFEERGKQFIQLYNNLSMVIVGGS